MNGRRLRELREQAVLSQSDLAERAHVNERTIRALENGYYPTAQPRTIRKLAEALGVEARDLVAPPARDGGTE